MLVWSVRGGRRSGPSGCRDQESICRAGTRQTAGIRRVPAGSVLAVDGLVIAYPEEFDLFAVPVDTVDDPVFPSQIVRKDHPMPCLYLPNNAGLSDPSRFSTDMSTAFLTVGSKRPYWRLNFVLAENPHRVIRHVATRLPLLMS